MMILILPFMHMQSGHHQVADALAAHIQQQDPTMEVEKLDIFSTTFPQIEKLVCKSYLTWIQKSPKTYSAFYKKQFNSKKYSFKLFAPWEKLMEETLERIILEKKPEAIICTHSFPSHAAGRLKEKGLIDVPVMNAYTDFFVGGVWAKEGIDLHIVPSKTVGQFLHREYDVEEQRILVSGIPVHPAMTTTLKNETNNKWELLIAGGNSGLGNLAAIAKQSEAFEQLHVTILCGNNRSLYEEITQMNLRNVTALSYIDSREQMNALYERADALISKPGGVTISEAFVKHVPVFVSSVLPGQEQLNMDYLVQKGLVFPLEEGDMLTQVMGKLMQPEFEQQYSDALAVQRNEVELATATLVDRVLYQLHATTVPHFSKKLLLASI